MMKILTYRMALAKTALILMTLLLASMISTANTTDSGPQISDFRVGYHIGRNDEIRYWGYSMNVLVNNPIDDQIDNMIPEVTDDEGIPLVEVAVINNGQNYILGYGGFVVVSGQENLFFYVTNLDVAKENMPIGAFTANLIKDGAVIATISLTSPYVDQIGNPMLPEVKLPELISPCVGVTLLDTTPTIEWRPLIEPYPGAETGLAVQVEFSNYLGNEYYWIIYPPHEATSVTFPEASEYPDLPQIRSPPDPDFPAHLPIGNCLINLIIPESFSNVGGDPRCSFFTAYHTLQYFSVNARADVVPDVLNLKSNIDGLWAV